MEKSIYNGEYMEAGIDLLSGAAGYGADWLIGAGVAMISSGAPVLIISAVAFTGRLLTGVWVDREAGKLKNSYYKR